MKQSLRQSAAYNVRHMNTTSKTSKQNANDTNPQQSPPLEPSNVCVGFRVHCAGRNLLTSANSERNKQTAATRKQTPHRCHEPPHITYTSACIVDVRKVDTHTRARPASSLIPHRMRGRMSRSRYKQECKFICYRLSHTHTRAK